MDDTKVESSGDEMDDFVSQPAASAKKKRKSAAERRAALPLSVWSFINPNCCRRKIILEFFEDHKADQDTCIGLPPPERCCNICSPKLRRYTPIPATSSVLRRPRKGSPEALVMEKITAWCTARSNALLPNAAFTAPADLFLAEEVIIQLANAGSNVQSMEKLTAIVTPEWEWLDEYGEDLLQALQDISAQAIEQWKAAWRSRSDKRRASQKEQITTTPFKETPRQVAINALFQDISKVRKKVLSASALQPSLQPFRSYQDPVVHTMPPSSQAAMCTEEGGIKESTESQLLMSSIQSLHLS